MLGNVGAGGKVHVAITKHQVTYGGKDVRALVLSELRTTVNKSRVKVVNNFGVSFSHLIRICL